MLVSIVIPVFNSAKTIRSAINSVILQSFKNYELIIVDGNSTDGTLDIILEFHDFISSFKSEPDVGYADALNKGIEIARGEYILMLAADDYLFPDALECFSKSLSKDTDVWSGSLVVKKSYGYRIQRSNPELDQLMKGCSLHNPASFYRRTLFMQYGLFRTDLKCASDREMFMRLYVNKVKFQVEDIIIVLFSLGGLSTKDPERFGLPEDERISIEYGMSSDYAKYLTKLHRLVLLKERRRAPIIRFLAQIGMLNLVYSCTGRGKLMLSRSKLFLLGIPSDKHL
jgi:glycosyltransferase involved in cell wall biosynthesis